MWFSLMEGEKYNRNEKDSRSGYPMRLMDTLRPAIFYFFLC